MAEISMEHKRVNGLTKKLSMEKIILKLCIYISEMQFNLSICF